MKISTDFSQSPANMADFQYKLKYSCDKKSIMYSHLVGFNQTEFHLVVKLFALINPVHFLVYGNDGKVSRRFDSKLNKAINSNY